MVFGDVWSCLNSNKHSIKQHQTFLWFSCLFGNVWFVWPGVSNMFGLQIPPCWNCCGTLYNLCPQLLAFGCLKMFDKTCLNRLTRACKHQNVWSPNNVWWCLVIKHFPFGQGFLADFVFFTASSTRSDMPCKQKIRRWLIFYYSRARYCVFVWTFLGWVSSIKKKKNFNAYGCHFKVLFVFQPYLPIKFCPPAAPDHHMYAIPPCALPEILPAETSRARQIGNASHSTNTFLTFLKFLVCIHPGNARVPPRVLASGPKPCGGNQRFSRFFRGLHSLLVGTLSFDWFILHW